MKTETVLSSEALETIHKRLGTGGSLSSAEASLSLIDHREDHVWIWNETDRSLLVAVTGSSSGPGADVQTVSLSQCPGHEVTGLSVSRSGRWVSLWGTRGVTLVQMPPRGGVGGRFGGGREELTARSQVLDTGDQEVQGVSWHPGSAAECHLVILTRSGVLSLYNVMEIEDRMLVLKCPLSRGGNSKVAAALGEVAVDFCFGSQCGEAGVWPLFVILASMDVFCVSAGLAEDEWAVEGPLEVKPPLEDNYSDGEACSVAEVGGVLAMATVTGILYHAIILGGDTTSLHVYERVELETSAVSSSHDDVFSCPLRLVTPGPGVHMRPGYLASHPAGLHSVSLTMVSVLKQAELAASAPDLDSGSSSVEHLVCTRPAPSSSPAPVLGACMASPPATVLCLLSSNSLSCLPVKSPASPLPALLSDDTEEASQEDTRHHYADSQLLALLARKSTQPLLKAAPSTELTPALTLELLTGATGTLRREYMARLEVARAELLRRVAELGQRRDGQEKLLQRLERLRTKARDEAEALSERHEDVRDRGQELGARVEAVLSKLQAKIPQLSDKELAMAREVSSLDRKVQALEGGVKQLRDKERYQRTQIGAGEARGQARVGMRDTRLDNIKEVLQRDSKTIADLVKNVNELKKDLEM